jgi:hypothetical protein
MSRAGAARRHATLSAHLGMALDSARRSGRESPQDAGIAAAVAGGPPWHDQTFDKRQALKQRFVALVGHRVSVAADQKQHRLLHAGCLCCAELPGHHLRPLNLKERVRVRLDLLQGRGGDECSVFRSADDAHEQVDGASTVTRGALRECGANLHAHEFLGNRACSDG